MIAVFDSDEPRDQQRTEGGFVVVRGGKKVYRGK